MNYEKLLELIISKISLIIVIIIIVTGVVIVSALNSIPQNVEINSPYDQTERISPFTVRENTIEMWGDDDEDYNGNYD